MRDKIIDRIQKESLSEEVFNILLEDIPFSDMQSLLLEVYQKKVQVDGGFTNWTQKLLDNRKERLMISGIGTERLVHCFL